MSKLYIGTSGYSYPHWQGVFYPRGLSQSKWLEFYTKHFNCVELNVTFYRLVQKKTFQNWYKRTPEDFSFVVKGSRFITHIKRLKGIKESLGLFIDNVLELKDKLAAILWQLPPSMKKDIQALERFLNLFKKTKIRQVFEFRNQSWFDEQVFDLLKKRNICLCIANSDKWPMVKEVTADFLYLRFHGINGLYSGNYPDRQLRLWSDFARGYPDKDIFAFFNNDAYGYAVKNALRFRELLEK